MAEEKKEAPDKPPVEETKWWIDRGPVKAREKQAQLGRGIIEQWVYEMLKDYNQEQAARSVVDINPRLLKDHAVGPGEWGYLSLGVGSYPAGGLDKIKSALRLPPDARALVIDAGYSVRVLITGEPPGKAVLDINFTEAPSVDYWISGELVEERLFSSVNEALKRLRGLLPGYLNPPRVV